MEKICTTASTMSRYVVVHNKEKDNYYNMAVLYIIAIAPNKIASISQSWIIEKARAKLFFKFIHRRHRKQ
jgi:hypothetical protein